MKVFWLVFFIAGSALGVETIPDEDTLSRPNICKANYCEFETTSTIDYQYALFRGKLEFTVRAAENVHLILANKLNVLDPLFKLCIGCNGNKISTLNPSKPISSKSQVTANTPNILNVNKDTGFWIRFVNNILLVGHKTESEPFLAWQSSEPVVINYIGFHTSTGKGLWKVGDSKCWITGEKGKVPEGAVQGGIDNNDSKLYVGRVRYHNLFSNQIGQVSSIHGQIWAPAEGKEIKSQRYDVLVAKKAEWKRFDAKQMNRKELLAATNAGQIGDKPIQYVARMKVNDRLTPAHFIYEEKKCFASFEGQQVVKGTDCEILFSTC